jgi:hypothetical protein
MGPLEYRIPHVRKIPQNSAEKIDNEDMISLRGVIEETIHASWYAIPSLPTHEKDSKACHIPPPRII